MPYLLALATSSNIGSAATLIGNPQNMYIGTTAALPFAHFTITMLPVVIVGLILCYLTITTICRKQLHAAFVVHESSLPKSDTLYPSSLPLQAGPPDHDHYLIWKTLVLLAALVIFFLVARGLHAAEHRAIATLVGAALLLCSHRAKAAKLYQLVDFNLILLFFGLFVVNGAMQQRHLTDALFAAIARAKINLQNVPTLAMVTTILSNLISNVPAVLLLRPSISGGQSWYLLALISTWAGNLTLVGSIANLIVAEQAAPYGVDLNLWTYCKVGVPLTILTIVIGTVWIMLVM